MAIKVELDEETLGSLAKRTKIINREPSPVEKKTTATISNTLTGIQNAFNRILTYSKNRNRIEQAKLEDTAAFNKETSLEAPKAAAISAPPVSTDTSTLLDMLPKLTKIVKKLDKEVGDLDLSSQQSPIPSPIEAASSFSPAAAIGGAVLAGGAIAAASYMMSPDEEPEQPQPQPVVVPVPEEESQQTVPPKLEQVQRKTQRENEKMVNTAVKAASATAVPVKKPEPTKAIAKEGNEWTGKVSSFIGDTYRNVTSFMGGFLAKLSALASQVGDFFSNGAQSLSGFFGFGGGPGFQQADVTKARGEWAKDSGFVSGVNQLAQKWDIDAGDLLGLMQSESNLNPQARNPSGATGLIQFMPDTARAMGTTTEAISRLNRTQQLALVDRYFQMQKLPKGATAGQLYATVFLPAYNRKPDNFVVARANGANDAGKFQPKWYSQNAGLDVNRDGAITIADLGMRLSKKRQEIGLGASRAGSGFRALGNLAAGAFNAGAGLFQQATSALTGVGNFIFPLATVRVTSQFGPRSAPTGGASSQHMGVDFGPRVPGQSGDPVHASAAGTVTKAGPGTGYGNVVYIDHGNGIETRYAHLMAFTTGVGQRVVKGQQIGLLGNTGVGTGPHLHFEVRRNGNAVNPLSVLRASVPVRPDASATEPGKEQNLKPGQKPVAAPTSQLARDAQTVAIEKKKAAQQPQGTSIRAPGQGRKAPAVAVGGSPPPRLAKKSAMEQFLSYFGAN